MKKVILLTGNELRHRFFCKYLSNHPKIKVLNSFCESSDGDIKEVIKKDKKNSLREGHLIDRDQAEKDFFELYLNNIEDVSNSIFIKRGDINKEEWVSYISDLKPDILISFGCSIIKSKLLDTFNKKFINIHLGLSPYYRGSGTNFWPIVNNDFSLIGTTFMHIDKGIDTGSIIHQIRANIYPFDNIHSIGNRLIKDSILCCADLIINFDKVKDIDNNINFDFIEKVYRKGDFNEDSIVDANNDLKERIYNYLNNKVIIDEKFPIIKSL